VIVSYPNPAHVCLSITLNFRERVMPIRDAPSDSCPDAKRRAPEPRPNPN
jgi:hypothetical protein